MSDVVYRVYCAGPLFNEKEREEMLALSEGLRSRGLKSFLPQRDGLEFAPCVEELVSRGVSREVATEALARAIFALDVYQVVEDCDGIIVNLNGRVPDEGAVSEAAIAWAMGKPVIAYKTDVRSAFMGHDNPLVTGLFGFHTCGTIGDAVHRMHSALQGQEPRRRQRRRRKHEIQEHLALGRRIWDALHERDKTESIAEILSQEVLPSQQQREEKAGLAVPP